MTASCEVCGGTVLIAVDGYEHLRRVTSDCRPFPAGGRLFHCADCGAVQKRNDATWQADCARIYSAYDSYGLTGGVEQVVRSADGRLFAPRSEIVLRQWHAWTEPSQSGRLLDFGCGKGPTSRAASRLLPDWTIDGFDQDARAADLLSAVPGFDRLYTGASDALPDGAYDLIVLMHVLEHVAAPATLLRRLARKLRPGGQILIEVPDRDANPYDLLVADHLLHFDLRTLLAVGQAAGLAPAKATRDWVGKELSLVLSPEARQPASAVQPSDIGADRQVGWLRQTAAIARHAAQRRPFCIFGTSIVGTWLASELDRPPDLFLDEDAAKIGLTLDGVPIIAPAEAPRGAAVVLAIAPAAADAVARRLTPLGLAFVPTPPYPPA
jgi:SAM-dependent methyltransferase